MEEDQRAERAAGGKREVRWSARRKEELVMRLLRGESLDLLARETGQPAGRISTWREEFLAAGREGLKSRPAEPEDRPLAEAQRKVGELSMEVDILKALGAFVDQLDEQGHRLVRRNGRAKERRGTVGSGTVGLRAPRVDDRRVDEQTGERMRYGSQILPRYARRSPKVSDVLPVLYLRGLSTGDFRPALRELLGDGASGLSASAIARLSEQWRAEHEAFRTRRLDFTRYAYLFVDGVHVSVRLGSDDRLCLLVVIGVREDGRKELLAVEDGYRESSESWACVLRDLRTRGLNEPRLVTGDGALGAWAALRDVYPKARQQRCWVHKIANVLDAVPKRVQPRAKALLHEIMEGPTRAAAGEALEELRRELGAKYPKAVEKLDRDRDALLAFYDFPAEHWRHLRTTDENVKVSARRSDRISGDRSVATRSRRATDRLPWSRSGRETGPK